MGNPMMQNLVFTIDFVLLFLVSYYLRQRYLRGTYSTTSAAGAVMALGIFVLSVLPYLPADFLLFRPYLTLELIIIWLFIAESYLQCYLQKHFYIHTRHIQNRINMGTWVVSTAILSLVWLKSFPEVEEISLLLAFVAFGIWIEYMRIMLGDLNVIARNPVSLKLNGNIFLLTVSTQSIAILTSTILHDWLPVAIMVILILLGYFYYGVCLILSMRHYLQLRLRHVVLEWAHSNSMLHGALSISGIACIRAGVVDNTVIISTWIAAVLLFILVESIAFLRLLFNIHKKGFQAAVWKYDISQWSRSFTYGLFYAFTILIERVQPIAWKPVTFFIIQYGKYVVLLLLLIEVTLFFQAKSKPMIINESLTYRDAKK
jgi:hypothetical protein